MTRFYRNFVTRQAIQPKATPPTLEFLMPQAIHSWRKQYEPHWIRNAKEKLLLMKLYRLLLSQDNIIAKICFWIFFHCSDRSGQPSHRHLDRTFFFVAKILYQETFNSTPVYSGLEKESKDIIYSMSMSTRSLTQLWYKTTYGFAYIILTEKPIIFLNTRTSEGNEEWFFQIANYLDYKNRKQCLNLLRSRLIFLWVLKQFFIFYLYTLASTMVRELLSRSHQSCSTWYQHALYLLRAIIG